MDIRAEFKDFLDKQNVWQIKQALDNASVAQVLWNDFANNDYALWVQDQIRSYLSLTPTVKSIDSKNTIDDEQHRFLILSDDNTMVSKVPIYNYK